MTLERRKHTRIRLAGPSHRGGWQELKPIPAAFKTENVLQVLGTSTKRGEGHIGSLSREGLFFATETPPTVGEFVTVIISDRSGSKIEVCGTVRSTTTQLGVGNSGFGMQLESLTDEYLEFYEGSLTS